MKNTIKQITSTLILLPITFLMFGCFCPHRYVPKINPDPPPPFFVPEKIPIALVLGSGGIRGMAHVGVIEELEKAGICIDLIVGCSAGSIVGALYADNPNIEVIKEAVWKVRTDTLFDIDLWNCRFGLSQGRCMHRILREYLGVHTFEQLQIPLVIVASDLNSAELVPMGSGNLLKAVQASCSVPLVFVPCEHLGRVLVDGGVINPVPVKVAHDLGAEIIIAVDLCELLPKTFPRNLFQVAERSAEIAFLWQNDTCTHNADVIICPKTCGVGTFNDAMKGQIYEAGKKAAREQIPRILELIAAKQAEGVGFERCENLRLYQPQCYTPEICREP